MDAKNPHLPALKKRVASSPTEPGVYKWLNENGDVLYVGKAKNLRNRLKSYVQKPDKSLGPWKLSLVEKMADLDVTVTNSEVEALVLETNLIKELKPKYNVLMKDDKHYVYVKVTVKDPYPMIDVVRKMDNDGAKYFGPYLKAFEVKHILDVLQDILNYRERPADLEKLNRLVSKGENEPVLSDAASLDEQIGQSCGVARGMITKAEYQERITSLVAFFKGDHAPIIAAAKERMAEAATNKKFEKAAKLRDALLFIQNIADKQIASDTSGENIDVFGVALSKGKALVQILQERGGKLIAEKSHSLKGEPDTKAEALQEFLPQYYSSVPDLPDILVLPEEIEDQLVLQEWLSSLHTRQVEIRIPERGKKSQLLDLAEKNANEKVKQLEAKWESAARNVEDALNGLKDALNLPDVPKRIEGYDISHLGGTETVGSMVVTKNGKPANADYRNFTIQSLKSTEVDDYKALQEVLKRRLLHLVKDLKASIEQLKEDKEITVSKAKKAEVASLEQLAKDHKLSDDGLDYKQYVVARSGKEIVAQARLFTEPDKTKRIRSVWVKEEFRGDKLGHLIIGTLLKQIKNDKVYLITKPDLSEYYAEIGFRHVVNPPEHLAKKLKGDGIVLVWMSKDNKADKSLQSRPDLLVIDGGKGQLSAVKQVLDDLELEIPVIGLAKREEEVFIPSQSHPINLKADSQASFMLQRLRNEAHRVANAHREKRIAKGAFGSALDDVTGIGPKSKQELLKAFGSVSGIKDASDAELLKFINAGQLEALRQML